MALDLYSKSTTDTLLAAKLDLAGGTMTGGLTLSASGIIFSDATYLTTAPAGSSLAADQLTAGVVAANPIAGPTASGDVLQYDGAALVWAPGGGGGGSYLPLAGGTMTGAIVFDGTSGQYISKGNFDTSRGGNYGISLVCSIGYEFNWQAGWLTTTEQGTTTPRPLYLDSAAGTTLRAWDSATSTGTEISHTGLNIGNTTEYFINAAPDLLKVFESTNNLGVSIAHDSIAIQHIDTPDRTSYFTNEYIGFEDLSGTPHSTYIEHDVITVQDDTATTQMRSTGITLSTTGAITFGDATTQTTAGLGDAPSDGFAYNRKDGAWEIAGSGGSVAWGAISGTLTDQTDLVSYVTGQGYQTAGDVSTYVGANAYPLSGNPSGFLTSVPGKTVYDASGTVPYTLQASDANNIVFTNNSSGGTGIYVPEDSTYNFPVGTVIMIVSSDIYNTISQGGSGVTVNSGSGGQVGRTVVNLVKTASNTWFFA